MFEKKYSMTQEENVFWAKRNLVDYIWKSANLEGIGVTFPETQTIVEGISVQGKSIDDINSIVQLKHGWQMVFDTIDAPLDLDYIKKLHLIIGRMTVINSGSLRMDEVRIAMLAANKLLIQHGCGVLPVSQDRLEKFFTLLVSYYEDDTRAEELKEFLYNECLDGLKSMK